MANTASHKMNRLDCLDWLALGNFGQLLMTRSALPVAVPARYLVEDDRVLVHVLAGPLPISIRDGDVVCLQVTVFGPDQRTGWNVSVTGRVHSRPYLAAAIPACLAAPWIPDDGGNLIELTTELVDGERLGQL